MVLYKKIMLLKTILRWNDPLIKLNQLFPYASVRCFFNAGPSTALSLLLSSALICEVWLASSDRTPSDKMPSPLALSTDLLSPSVVFSRVPFPLLFWKESLSNKESFKSDQHVPLVTNHCFLQLCQKVGLTKNSHQNCYRHCHLWHL